MSPLIHGGDIATAAQTYGYDQADWIDVSTGINVYSYPVPSIPTSAWQQLPYLDQACLEAAHHYYGTEQLLLSAGSQPVIEKLPALLSEIGNRRGILIPHIGYQEHRQAWQQATQVIPYQGLEDATAEINAKLSQPDSGHLLIINPNNPTGVTYGAEQIYQWAEQLAPKQGFVIVDEAFMDCQPKASCISTNMPANLLVLRSFGKFFGLAGVRLGALVANPKILTALAQQLGIWQINGPAQVVATAAFGDQQWQQQMRHQLATEQAQQRQLWQPTLTRLGASMQADTPLFRSFKMPASLATRLHQQAAQQGILSRPIDIDEQYALLRLGNIDITNQSHLQRCHDWLQSLT